MAGNLSIETLGSIWQKPDRRGSSHYGINGNKVGQYVKESDIAWTDGNWESNRRSVTIETANSTGDPTWEIAGATYQTLIKLVADIARRNNFGTLVKGQNVTWHSMYSATQCPGPDLLRLMDSIVSEANRLLVEQPSTGVYLRKLGTDKFLGLDVSNQIAFVGANSARRWIKNGETLSDYNDPSLKLKVANDGVTPIRSSSTSDGVNARCVSDGNGSVMIVAPTSQLRSIGTEKALTATQTFPRFKSKDGDSFKECSSTDIALDPVKPSAIPDAFKNRLIRIKRNNDGRYLTLEDNDGQKTVTLKAPFTGESQIWKVKQLDASGNIFGIVSHADENCILRMNDVTNGCFISSNTGSDFAGTGVSITHDQEIGGYTIMLSTNHRYLDIFTDVDGAAVNSDLMWTKMDSVGWEIEEHVENNEPVIVDGWLRLYPKPTCNKTGRTIEIPVVESFVDANGTEYKFENRNYWYTWENPYGENKINPYAIAQITNLTGKSPIINVGQNGEYTDENNN